MFVTTAMKLGSGAACFVLAWIGLSLTTSALAEDAWITATAGTQYRIIDDGTTKKLPIPVTLKTIKPAQVSLQVLAVRLDNVLLPELLPHAFKVGAALSAPEAASPMIELEVNTRLASRPGSYEVWIEARAKAGPQKAPDASAKDGRTQSPANAEPPSPQILKISIEHPVAVVRAPAKLTAQLVRGTLTSDKFEATPLPLELISDVSRLSNLVLGSIRFPAATDPISGSLTLTKPLTELRPGAPTVVPWTVTGEFPLGVTEAETEIRGDQLKDAVPVKVAIKTRRSLLWFWVATIVGLALGWTLKVGLETYLQRARGRREGALAVEAIGEQLRRFPDPWLKDVLRDKLTALSKAVRGTDVAAMTKAATEAQQELAKQLPELQRRQQELRDKINTWLKAVGPKRELSELLQGIVSAADSDLRKAAVTLSSDLAAAQAKLDEVTQALPQDLRDLSARWKEATKSALGDLADPAHPVRMCLPRPISEQLAATATAIRTSLDGLNTTPADATATGTLLEGIDTVRRQLLTSLIEQLGTGLKRFTNRVLQALSPSDGGAVVGADLRAGVKAVQDMLTRGSIDDRLSALADGSPHELAELTQINVRFEKLLSPGQVADQDVQKQIADLLKARDFEGAARRIAEAKKSSRRKDENEEDIKLGPRSQPGGPGAPDVAADTWAFAIEPSGLGATPGRWVDLVTPEEPIMPAAEARMTEAQSNWQIRIAGAAQTVFAGALFLAVAHVTYAEKYVGTFPELAAIFFWAFSVDVTLSKLTEAAKALGKTT